MIGKKCGLYILQTLSKWAPHRTPLQSRRSTNFEEIHSNHPTTVILFYAVSLANRGAVNDSGSPLEAETIVLVVRNLEGFHGFREPCSHRIRHVGLRFVEVVALFGIALDVE